MLSEVNLLGVYVAPFMIYAGAALPIFLVLRRLLAHAGLLRWFWHPALFECALWLSITALLVHFA
jgi:hypothetical protein